MYVRTLLLVFSLMIAALPVRGEVPEAPEGWSHDRKLSEAGIEIYTSPDEKITVIAGPTQPATNAPLPEWLAGSVAQIINGKTIIEDGPKRPRTSGNNLIASHTVTIRDDDGTAEKLEVVAKRLAHSGPIQLVRISTQDGADPIQGIATTLIVLSVDLPFIDNAAREKVINEAVAQQEREAEAEAKVDAEAEAKAKAEAQAAAKPPPNYRTATGEGIASGDLLRLGHNFGTTQWDAYGSRIIWVGVETWVQLRDGTAYRYRGIPPADFDAEKSRTDQPGRWRKNDTLKGLTWFEVRENGTRVALSLKRPKVSGSSYSPRTETRYLTLYEDGRFDTARVSFSHSSMPATENSTFTSSSSSKDGASSSYSGTTDAGNAVVSTQNVQRQRGINPSHMGSYTIDGLTIELRFDDGRVQRSLFGYDDDGHAIFDGDHYFE